MKPKLPKFRKLRKFTSDQGFLIRGIRVIRGSSQKINAIADLPQTSEVFETSEVLRLTTSHFFLCSDS